MTKTGPARSAGQVFQCRGKQLELGKKTYVMGILNVTPDSFADGGRYLAPEAALRQAQALLAAGADILDIGGESTRPGSQPVSAEEELARVMPVIKKVKAEFDCLVSLDTSKASVAGPALAAGVEIINDINGLQMDAELALLAAEAGAGVVLMHNARLYQRQAQDLLVDSMQKFFRKSLTLAAAAGLAPDQLMLDPGIGFGVLTDDSLAMIRQLAELKAFGLPLLVGPSGKRFIGEVLQLPVQARLPGTATAVTVAIAKGADVVRVHDVTGLMPYVKMADAICRGREVT